MTQEMNPIIKVFMDRDGMDYCEARGLYYALKQDMEMLGEQYDEDEVFEEACDHLLMYSLEPEYLTYLM